MCRMSDKYTVSCPPAHRLSANQPRTLGMSPSSHFYSHYILQRDKHDHVLSMRNDATLNNNDYNTVYLFVCHIDYANC